MNSSSHQGSSRFFSHQTRTAFKINGGFFHFLFLGLVKKDDDTVAPALRCYLSPGIGKDSRSYDALSVDDPLSE